MSETAATKEKAVGLTEEIASRLGAYTAELQWLEHIITEALMQERDRATTVWVAAAYYPYEGYGEPERAFATKELAEAWKAADRNRRDYEIFELPIIRADTTQERTP